MRTEAVSAVAALERGMAALVGHAVGREVERRDMDPAYHHDLSVWLSEALKSRL